MIFFFAFKRNNQLSFTKSGTFQIRATYRGKYSEWISVKALPKKALTTLTISDDTQPATLESFIYNDQGTPKEIDLSKLTVKAFDQYDGEWKDTSDVRWAVEIDGQSAAFTELSQNKLPIHKAGIYKITAVSQKYNVTSNVVELNVKPARKLSSVTIQTDLEKNGIGIGSM